jgi:hypothetical protein
MISEHLKSCTFKFMTSGGNYIILEANSDRQFDGYTVKTHVHPRFAIVKAGQKIHRFFEVATQKDIRSLLQAHPLKRCIVLVATLYNVWLSGNHEALHSYTKWQQAANDIEPISEEDDDTGDSDTSSGDSNTTYSRSKRARNGGRKQQL